MSYLRQYVFKGEIKNMDFKQFMGKDIQIKFFHFQNRTVTHRGRLVDFNRHYLVLIGFYSKRKLLIHRPVNIRFSVKILDNGGEEIEGKKRESE